MMSRMGFGDTQTNAERSYDICHAIVRHLSCNRVTYVKQSPNPRFHRSLSWFYTLLSMPLYE